jgi:phosphoglycolate phosphatase
VIRLAVFDCDGTLVDGQASICDAMEAAFAAFGLAPPGRNEIRRAVGLSLPQAAQRLLPDATAARHHEIAEAYKVAFRDARTEGRISQPLFDGIPEALDGLRAAGWQLAVATGMSERGLSHCLAMHGISDRFVSLQTADHHPSKPHPAMLEAALLEAGAEPAQAVMIGDTMFDIHMAIDAGVRAVGVAWGYHAPAELIEAGAEHVAATPGELAEYLLR